MDEEKIYQALADHFGYHGFRDGQLATVKSLLAGEDTLAVLPTGAGKSLLYQLPAYLLSGPVLVVSPLISLMQDQVDRLHQNGEKRVLMLSGHGGRPGRRQQLRLVGRAKFIFASPELLAQSDVIQALKAVKLSLLAVDEAHCISQWGPDFRPEYLLLKDLRQRLGLPVTLLLTATATPRVQQDILDKVGIDAAKTTRVIRSVNRPNIFLAARQLSSPSDKQAALLQLVRDLPGAGIIYFASRRLASASAEWLRAHGFLAVAAYHAGMSAADRYHVQQQFMDDQLQVVCATSAFGMGIDKDNIRFVIHYHQPTSLEAYVQEIGRAGRDGKQSVAVLLSCPGDDQLARQLTSIELPSEELLRRVQKGELPEQALGVNQDLLSFYFRHGYRADQIRAAFQKRQRQLAWQRQQVQNYLNNSGCRRRFLLSYFGEDSVAQGHCCDLEEPDWLTRPLLTKRRPVDNDQSIKDWDAQLRWLLNLAKESTF